MVDWRMDFATPKFIIALMAVGVFVWAFGHDPSDATMKGAIIGGFNLALGFYLGSTNSASRATENTARAFEAITATANASASATPTDAIADAADATAAAAQDKADEIKGHT